MDLASSTEIGIIEAINKEFGAVYALSPTDNFNDSKFHHTQFKKIRFKGLETFSGGYFLRNKIKHDQSVTEFSNCIIVDWCYVPSLRRELKRIGKPWFIIDRGPPVYRSLLTKIQKRIWKRAWEIASEDAMGGFVVSDKHKEMVKKIGIKFEIHVLNAGTNLSDFNPVKGNINDRIELAYCGRIDKNRGIDSIINLSKRLQKEGINHTIHAMGEGDYVKELKDFANENKSLIYHGKMTRKKVYTILETSHVGIMPMPDKTVWRTASPLKLAEYMASGLLVIGQNHSGNRISENEEWSFLVEGDEWHSETPKILNKIIEDKEFSYLSNMARKSAEKYDWSVIADKMIEYIGEKIKE